MTTKTSTETMTKFVCVYCKRELTIINFRELIDESDSAMRHRHGWTLAEGSEWV